MVISVSIQKGGSGKTTTALNLAAALRERGKKVLLLDLDPQCNLTQAMGIRHDPTDQSIYKMLDLEASGEEPDIRTVIQSRNGMDFVPAAIDLAKAELKLVSVYGREKLLRNIIEPIRHEYEFIFIDCPPAVGMLTVNSWVASDSVLLPLQAEYLPMRGLVSTMEIIKKEIIAKKINPNLSILGILLTRYDARNSLTPHILEILSNMFPHELFKTRIRTSIALAKAQEIGIDIFTHDKNARGAIDYMALAEEVLGRV